MEIKVPDIGDFSDVPVITILVAVGDEVAEEDPLIELESDKATMEVPSPAAGKVASIAVKEGDTVSEGSLILTLEGAASADSAPPPPQEDELPRCTAIRPGNRHGQRSGRPSRRNRRSGVGTRRIHRRLPRG